MSEFSEENILFYFACEDYRRTKSAIKLPAKAQTIYDEFIGSDAPREVSRNKRFKSESLKLNDEDPLVIAAYAKEEWKTNLTLLFFFQQINIDHETRDITRANMLEPSLSCFDSAQHKIYMLMAKDCYPRFLRSPTYRDLLRQAKPSTKATARPEQQQKV